MRKCIKNTANPRKCCFLLGLPAMKCMEIQKKTVKKRDLTLIESILYSIMMPYHSKNIHEQPWASTWNCPKMPSSRLFVASKIFQRFRRSFFSEDSVKSAMLVLDWLSLLSLFLNFSTSVKIKKIRQAVQYIPNKSHAAGCCCLCFLTSEAGFS